MIEVKIALEDLRDGLLDGAEPAVSSRPTIEKRWWLVGTLMAFVLGCAAAGFWLRLERKPDSGGPLEITQLTKEGGLNIDPAISPDGKLLTYASDHGGDGNLNIWMKQIGGGDPIRLTRDQADDVEPNFSPDGTKIVFRSAREGGGLYLIPALGPAGTEQRLVDGGRRPRFSPDGSRIAYWTGPENPFPLRKGMGQMFVFDLATSTTRPLREDFAAAVDPVWSPDGKNILFVGLRDPADVPHTYDWWITPVAGGTAVQCHMLGPHGIFYPFAWRANRAYWSGLSPNWDGRRNGVVTIDPRTEQTVGEPRRLTTGTTDEDSPSLSKDGHLVFSSLTGNSALYELPLDANRGKAVGAPQRLTPDEADNYAQSISADGKRMVFTSSRTGSFEIWGKDLATGQERALTTGGRPKEFPQITRDGQTVAWKTPEIRDRAIFATPFAGGAAVQLCADCGAPDAWTPDGKFLLFDQRRSGRLFEGLLQAATGARSDYLVDAQLGLMVSSISGDGKWVAFAAFRTDRDFTMYVAPFSPERPPPPSEWIRIPHSPKAHPNPRWSPDGNLLYFSSEQDGYSCIWAERMDPVTQHPRGEPFAVQHFHATSLKMVAPDFYYPIALASDKIVLSLMNRSAGLWMLRLQD
jgi:Tol biopolymer transport system component